MKDWSLSNLPPEGNKDVGKFFNEKVDEGDSDKVRLGLEERWHYNHMMFRGDHWNSGGHLKFNEKHLTMNLLFANIQRTIANLTAKQPTVEAIEVGEPGLSDKSDKVLTAWLYKWWNETNQGDSIVDSAHQMELYGPTIEKYFLGSSHSDTAVIDPFAFGKCPGVFDDIQDAPYVYHKAVMRTEEIEHMYDLEKGSVSSDETYTEMGEGREKHTPKPAKNARAGSVSMDTGIVREKSASSKDKSKGIVSEVWVRDYNAEKYPDGIRVITICNDGEIVLSDTRNPNINWALFDRNPALVDTSFLYGIFPFTIGNSYKDKTTNWGFSALEQTADINHAIDEIVSRLYAYVNRSTLPILIVPKDTGITLQQINNRPGLVLRPNTSATAHAIHYLEPPRISLDIYKFLDILRGFFDQIWHIEDADRGERPSGIIAAQAIQALQERNAVLMRAKIRTIDTLIENRGKAAISFLQNFGSETEQIKIEDDVVNLTGLELAGKEYKFVVESGSTVHKTMMQIQEQSVELYRMGAIDRQALLEAVDFPAWKSVIERTGETQLDQAIQILVDAGLEETEAAELKKYLSETQTEEAEQATEEVAQEPQPQGVG